MDVVDLLNEKRLAFVILLPQLRSVGFTRVKVKFSKQGWNEISQHRVEFYVMLPTSSHYDDDMNAKAKQKTLQTMWPGSGNSKIWQDKQDSQYKWDSYYLDRRKSLSGATQGAAKKNRLACRLTYAKFPG